MGKVNNPLLFLLDYPDEVEDRNHRPASGTDGALIRSELRRNGMEPKFASFAYTVNCYPGKKGKVEVEERQACSIHLRQTIELLQPKVVVAVGDLSWEALTPVNIVRLQEARGHYWSLDRTGDSLGTGILTPTEARRDSNTLRDWEIDMAVLGRVVEGNIAPRSEFCLKCGVGYDLLRFREGLPVCRTCVKKGL